MQTARELASAVHASYQTPLGSLRHFARFGAVAFGFAAGTIALANAAAEKESVLRQAIAERDAQIAELTSAKSKLEKAATGESEKTSSGDIIQDWIDALAE